MKRLLRLTTAIALSIAAVSTARGGAELNPEAISIRLPNEIPWKRNAAGTAETATLYGDSTKSGLYAVMQKWLPGNMSRPHWHPNDRLIWVVKGTWWVGTGEKFDPDSTTPIPGQLHHPLRQANPLGRRQGWRSLVAGDRRGAGSSNTGINAISDTLKARQRNNPPTVRAILHSESQPVNRPLSRFHPCQAASS